MQRAWLGRSGIRQDNDIIRDARRTAAPITMWSSISKRHAKARAGNTTGIVQW